MAIRKRPHFAIFISFKPCVFGFSTNIAKRSSSHLLSICTKFLHFRNRSASYFGVLLRAIFTTCTYTTSSPKHPSIHLVQAEVLLLVFSRSKCAQAQHKEEQLTSVLSRGRTAAAGAAVAGGEPRQSTAGRSAMAAVARSGGRRSVEESSSRGTGSSRRRCAGQRGGHGGVQSSHGQGGAPGRARRRSGNGRSSREDGGSTARRRAAAAHP